MNHSPKSAFTLVELAIVIVIIGLLVAGVVGAQSLIKSAKRNSFIQEFNQFRTAFNAFKLEYDAIPGDIRGYDYWSSNSDCANTTASVGYAGTECNGNNDKYINGWYSINAGTPAISDYRDGEPYLLWRHLHYAGLMNQKFESSTIGTSYYKFLPLSGISVTSEKLTNVNDCLIKQSPVWSLRNNAAGGFSFILHCSAVNNYPALTQKDALWIDTKLDDGKRNSGIVKGVWSWGCGEGGGDNTKYYPNYPNSASNVACSMTIDF